MRRLIARKPCDFGGRKFYIGEEIPEELVADPKKQERLGLVAIADAETGQASGTLVTAGGGTLPGGTVEIAVKTESGDGKVSVPATPEEIREVFRIMQMNAGDGAKAVSGVESENVLILLHAADSRKTVKEAAKKQADNLSSNEVDRNEASTGNETTDTSTEGSDA